MDRKPTYKELEERVYALEKKARERDRTERLLKEGENIFQTFFNDIDEFLFVLDEEGNILRINDTVKRRLGYREDDLIGKSVLNLHPEDRHEETITIISDMLSGKTKSCPIPVITKDRRQIPVETYVVRGAWSGRDVLFGVSKDISEIRESEEKFSKAFHLNAAPMAISTIEEGIFVDVNEAFLETTCYNRDEVIGKTSKSLGVFHDFRQRDTLLQSLKEKRPIKNIDIVIRTKTGQLRHGLFFAHTIHMQEKTYLLTMMNDVTEQKKTEAALIKAHDNLEDEVDTRTKELVEANRSLKKEIEERKRIEAELRKSEERFRILAESLPEMIYEMDLEGHLTFVNQHAFTTFGYTKSDFRSGIKAFDMLVPEDRKRAGENIQKIFRGEKSGPNEYRVLKKDGTAFPAIIYSTPILTDGKPLGLRGIIIDITDRKRAEALQLRNQTELEKLVSKRTAELRAANKELEIKKNNLEEANVAMKVLLERREKDKADLEEALLFNIKTLVMPYIEKLMMSDLNETQNAIAEILEANLNEVISPFSGRLSAQYIGLTPQELKVANLIRQGKTSKEIADLFFVSTRTIESHRENIREKMGLKNKKANLRTHLSALE